MEKNPRWVYPEDLTECACGKKAEVRCVECGKDVCADHLVEVRPCIYRCDECSGEGGITEPEAWWCYGT